MDGTKRDLSINFLGAGLQNTNRTLRVGGMPTKPCWHWSITAALCVACVLCRQGELLGRQGWQLRDHLRVGGGDLPWPHPGGLFVRGRQPLH